MVIVVVAAGEEVAGVCARLGELGVRAVRVVAPSDVRRLVLAAVDDEWEAERLAAALRREGRMAVTRPDGGPRLDGWVQHTFPITFGTRLTVCPAWSEHDRTDLPGLIELGLGGFGNGQHPSTRLLVEQLVERIRGGERVLDVGCGSGVLGLCALALGASRVVAVDVKAEAVEAARRNAALNEMDQQVEATVAPLGEIQGVFDVVMANIGRAAIVEVAPQLVQHVSPGGWLAVSGISPSQCSLVADFLRPLVEVGRHTSGEWSALVLAHPDPPSQVLAREGLVRNGPAQLFVRDVGDGLPIVVVHGGPDFDHEYLLPEMDRLAGSFHLVYYDQRGRGRSFFGELPEGITMATEVDDLDRVREWFGFESIAVLGHSWGGLLAMEYAIRHPQRVSHLILMNSAPASRADAIALREELARRRSPAQTERMNELRSDPRFRAGDVEREAEYYRIHFGTALNNPGHLDPVIRRLRAAFTEDGIVAARAIEDKLYEDTWARDHYDLIPALERLDIPTLIIHGDHDFVPIDGVRRIAETIPGSRMVIVPECGHFAYLEQPDQTSTSIAAFLQTP